MYTEEEYRQFTEELVGSSELIKAVRRYTMKRRHVQIPRMSIKSRVMSGAGESALGIEPDVSFTSLELMAQTELDPKQVTKAAEQIEETIRSAIKRAGDDNEASGERNTPPLRTNPILVEVDGDKYLTPSGNVVLGVYVAGMRDDDEEQGVFYDVLLQAPEYVEKLR